MEIIKIEHLTKKFKNGYGIFDINVNINEGEVYGYLGPNGAGKSTTIRHIMGYMKPEQGTVQVLGKNSWKQSNLIMPDIGYVPGEIELPAFMNGLEFIKYIYRLREQKNWKYVKELIKYWEFNPNISIKRMSKGMKQKLGLVVAFMHNPKLLILDEPTSGLDPLMQEKFIELIIRTKKEGKTILISSHIFSEIEKTCDRVAIIKSGQIVDDFILDKLIADADRIYEITFKDKVFESKFLVSKSKNSAKYAVHSNDVAEFFEKLKKYNIEMFKEVPFSLEQYFLKYYTKLEEKDNA